MANRYWVGGTASWDGTAGTKWSATSGGGGGASVPTSADDVFFDANSTGTVTIATGNTGAKSITCTGFTGTIAGSAAITVSGSITLVAGMSYTHSGTVTINATATLTTAGKTFSGLTINGSGITVTLGDALNISTRTLTVTQGTFTTSASNYAIIAGIVNISGSTTRTVTLNGSTITLSNASPWTATTTTNLTFNANTSTISLSNASAAFNGGGLTYNNVSFTSTTAGNPTINGANTFSQLTLTAPASAGLTEIDFAANQTITTFVCAGASAVRRLFLTSNTTGTARTLTVTTWSTISDVDFKDITMNTSRSGTRLGNCGGNTNITFDAAKTVYWNLSGTQNWSATGWATSSGGTPAVNNFPLAQDTAVFDNTGSAGTVTLDASWNIGSITATTRTSAMTLSVASSATVASYGDFTLGSGVTTSTGTNSTFSFEGRSTQNITTAGVTIAFWIRANTVGGTVKLLDALTSNDTSNLAIIVTNGTFDTNGFTVTLSGGMSVSGSGTKTLATSTSTIIIGGSGSNIFSGSSTGTTITGTGTIKMTSASAKSFQGGNINFGSVILDQGGAGALTISSSNTFGDISNSYSATGATTITLAANQTVANFTATGTVGKVLTLNSSASGTRRTLTKTGGGVVSVDYMSIRDSGAAGTGATWYAGANSTNVSNNTGWIFTAPTGGSNNFLLMFL